MRKKAPKVRDHMTHLPVEAERCETLADAEAVMAQHGIRHLPVMSGSKLLGIVTDRDILTARMRLGESADVQLLEDVCRIEVLTVSSIAPTDIVVDQMLDLKVDGAVVVDGGFVVGVFTTSDALRLLRDLFSTNG